MIIGGIGVTIVHFISTNEFILLSTMKYVKLSTLPLITFVVIFGHLLLLFILRQHTIPDSERNNIIWLHRTTRSYYFFCTYIARAISIFSVIGRFCVIVMVLILSQKPDEGKQI